MHSLPDGTRPPIDLSRYTESTRRALYDRVVEEHFATIPTEEAGAYAGPSFSPDDAGLTVFYAYARWFAAWTDLDEPDLPEDRRVQVLRIVASRDGALVFEEI